jgi:hypothetical protein
MSAGEGKRISIEARLGADGDPVGRSDHFTPFRSQASSLGQMPGQPSARRRHGLPPAGRTEPRLKLPIRQTPDEDLQPVGPLPLFRAACAFNLFGEIFASFSGRPPARGNAARSNAARGNAARGNAARSATPRRRGRISGVGKVGHGRPSLTKPAGFANGRRQRWRTRGASLPAIPGVQLTQNGPAPM